jgi:hypothetical protein
MNTLYNDSGLPSIPEPFVSYVNIFQTLLNSLLRNLANLKHKLVHLSLFDCHSTPTRICRLGFSIHRLLLFVELRQVLKEKLRE